MTPTFRLLHKAAATQPNSFASPGVSTIMSPGWNPPSGVSQQPEQKSFMGIDDDGWVGTAMDFIPGVNTVYSGGKALRDFSQGNIWGGLGNTAFAAMGLIPFAGGIAKGIGRAGKYLGKATGFGRMGRNALAATSNAARAAQRTNAGGRQLFNLNLGKGMGWNGGQGFNAGLRTGQLKTTGALMAGGMGAGMMDGTTSPAPQTAAPVAPSYYDPSDWSPTNAGAMGAQWMRSYGTPGSPQQTQLPSYGLRSSPLVGEEPQSGSWLNRNLMMGMGAAPGAYPQQTKLAAWRTLAAL